MNYKPEEIKELEQKLSQCQKKLNALEEDFDVELFKNNQAHANLLQRISKDMALPLNGILSAYQRPGGSALDSTSTEKLGIVHSVNHLMTLLQGVSTFALFLKNELRIEKREFSIQDLFRELIANNGPMANMVHIEIKKAYYSDIPNLVESDYVNLRQILSGFLSNALKNTKEGSVILSAEVVNKENDWITTRLMVSDTGKGLSKEHQKTIREELKRKKNSDELMITENIGLGLILASLLAQKLGGFFDFKSDKGVGSSFWIDIPLREIQSASKVAKSDKHPYETSRKRKVLLVEDNYLNQKFVAAALLKAGHAVEIAENGKIALEKYKSKRYDLILMDIQMPLIDGIETTKKIRLDEKKHRKPATPIIAVTAYAIEHDKKQCLDAGMNEYLTKPFRPNELLQIIDDL